MTTLYRSGRDRRRRRVRLACAAGALLAAAIAVVLLLRHSGQPDAARGVATRFAQRWTAADDAGAARLTDAPKVAAGALAANRRGLDGAQLHARVVSLRHVSGGADAVLELRWEVAGIGAWEYRTHARLKEAGGTWLVHWAAAVIHPKLHGDTRLGTTRAAPARADILDRSGAPLVTERPVVRVGLARNAVKDVGASSQALAAVLRLRAAAIARALRGAGPQQFVEVLTMRTADYRRVAAELSGIPGIETVRGRMPLGPTRDFGRALLGGVGPPTAEQVKQLGSRYSGTGEVGQWGLEAAFDRRLAGTPASSIVIRARGVPIETLLKRGGSRGRPLRTTLDRHVQAAAEAALGHTGAPSAIVAVRPSTGDILAVANRPTDSTYDRALAGQYPPGSTFKVVTTAALLHRGVTLGSSVPCPQTLTVDGKVFKNFEGEASGPVNFAEDFAKSCNTAFASLAGRLPFGALTQEAAKFGLGRPFHLPVAAAPSRVPAPRNRVERAAAMIGQDRTVASPLALAGVAATVADGRWRAPRLLSTDPRRAASPLPGSDLAALRTAMRQVVTAGTGSALRNAPGAISGKTGTAEFGEGDPPPTHAWFIAFRRSDIAIAVLVEHGSSGGVAAAPIAARFFGALP